MYDRTSIIYPGFCNEAYQMVPLSGKKGKQNENEVAVAIDR
jgi:hypothetical protein